MKQLVENYTFNASLRTITFNDYSLINQAGVLLITNTTDNIIIYNFANPLQGGAVTDNVLELIFDTTAMAGDDSLQIFYDDGKIVSTVDDDRDFNMILRLLLQKASESPVWYNMALNALQITGAVSVSGSLTTLTTCTTVGTLTNQANMGGQPADQISFNLSDTDWALTTRNLLNTVIV